jgi:putative ABC transport system permease protein
MLLEEFFQDLRIGLRVLVKEKGFCFLAVSVLTLGICAVTTQYAVVNGVLLHAFKFPGGERLVGVSLADPNTITPSGFNSRQTAADFVDLRAGTKSFDAFVGYLGNTTVTLTYEDNPQRLQGGYVPYDFFRVLGVNPALGRDFTAEDDRPGVTEAVMLSDAFWRSSFGADPAIVGRTVRINGRAGEVVGVMPPKFVFPTYEQVWIPFTAEFPVLPRNDRNTSSMSIIARLKPGVSREQAEADVTGMALQFARDYPDTNRAYTRGYIQPLIDVFTGGQLPALLYTMLAFCAGVLLIACVNVMNMQFARATLRSKELAIRSALGATRGRLIRQMLTESLLLAVLGAILGIALAFYATSYLNAAMATLTNPLPSWMSFTIDRRVLAFVVGMTVLAAVVAGFVPAWLASRARTADVLKEFGRGNTGRAVGIVTRGLVVCQILVTSVLLVGALLQVQSIRRQQNIDYGYDTTAILGARLGLMQADYPTPAKRQLYYERLLAGLRAEPQFEAVALTNRNRMVTSGAVPVEIEGRDYKSDSDRRVAQYETVSQGYFDVLGVRLREGHEFTDLDTDQRQPIAIVNAAFAHTYFGRESPLGRRLRTIQANGTNPGPWRTIVGVTGEIRMQGPFDHQSDGAGFFVPFFASVTGPTPAAPFPTSFSSIIVRPRKGVRPESVAPVVQAVSRQVDPNLPLYYLMTPRKALDGYLAQNRFIATMFGVFGVVAVLLASVGLYGIMSFSVNQRRQEFGIRMALGAAPSGILRLVLRQGARQLALGLCLGLGFSLACAIVGAAAMENLLFGVSPRDPATYLAVAMILGAVSLIAMLVPALRATRVNPMIALRAE